MKNLLFRFLSVWKPSFLMILLQKNKTTNMWKFWCFWMTTLIVIASFTFLSMWQSFSSELSVIADKWEDFPTEIQNGEFYAYDVDMPYVNHSDNIIFYVDSDSLVYDEQVVSKYGQGVILLKDRIVWKKNQYQSWDLSYDQYGSMFMPLSRDVFDTIIELVAGLNIFIVLALFSVIAVMILLANLLWALLCWGAGRGLMKIKEINYWNSFCFMMYVSIPVVIIQGVFYYLNFSGPRNSLYALFILLNLWYIDKNKS
ncbi:hypothetical protein COB57_03610 [Candidatus Peregrinibacteria bacterium]|nr:MAG: hypothetical protein COB57_03610 [Candidatus Peregrinibacteria bacterium]